MVGKEHLALVWRGEGLGDVIDLLLGEQRGVAGGYEVPDGGADLQGYERSHVIMDSIAGSGWRTGFKHFGGGS